MNEHFLKNTENEIQNYFKERIDGILRKDFVSNMSLDEYYSLPVKIRFSCIYLNCFPKYSAQSPIAEIHIGKNGRRYMELKNPNDVSIFINQLVFLVNHGKTKFRQIAHPVTSFLKDVNNDELAKEHVLVIWKLCLEWQDQFR